MVDFCTETASFYSQPDEPLEERANSDRQGEYEDIEIQDNAE